MSSFEIKILAVLFMVLDHIGVVIFPKYIFLRILGRIAFPLFAWMISISYRKTSNVNKFMGKLLIFATALQIPYSLLFKDYYLNIFFTLFFGLLSIKVYEITKSKKIIAFSLVLSIGLFAEFIKADYGIYGVMTIYIFYLFYGNYKNIVLSQTLLNIVNIVSLYLLTYVNNTRILGQELIQVFSLISLIIIYFYNGRRGKKSKYFFYIFYPIHLILIYSIKILLNYYGFLK